MSGVRGWLARELSSVYAGYQEAAGKAAGVEVGETWQVAFRAAVASGEPLHLLPFLPVTRNRHLDGNAMFTIVNALTPPYDSLLVFAADHAENSMQRHYLVPPLQIPSVTSHNPVIPRHGHPAPFTNI